VQAFRIAKNRYLRDLSGTGAMLYGGRWNQKNIPIIYVAENRALATVEYLVHIPLSIIPKNLSIACFEIPDDIIPEEVSIAMLPKNWRDYPAPVKLADLGSEWALAKRSLLLRVPSVVVADQFNLLINPNHPEITRVTISRIEKYTFNKRLLRR
jgi:RES domain-containing protein